MLKKRKQNKNFSGRRSGLFTTFSCGFSVPDFPCIDEFF